ncbi:hypothetical protein HDE69_001782 [Pedobacter cryoconitis]|uniref:Uncharacterized protein n=1 Tax=Pedobacter cryoconitis TaxID=188932 RepID=A0A7W8YRZ6_9SPHI|nr:hypothetical protein [Pedobacter cryoconitis]MBB5620733.1 hypothetical protein [Pedobacter cryoconitis]
MLKACSQPGVTPISIQAQPGHNRMKINEIIIFPLTNPWTTADNCRQLRTIADIFYASG